MNWTELNKSAAPFLYRHFDAAKRCRTWRKLATQLFNNVPKLSCLQQQHRTELNVLGSSNPSVYALAAWIQAIENGRTLSEAIVGWASPEEVVLIGAGERGNTLAESLMQAADLVESRAKIIGTVLKGVTYPCILLLGVFGLLYMFSTVVFPVFTKIIPVSKLHGTALLAVHVSEFIRTWIGVAAAVMALGIVAFVWSLPRMNNRFRTALDRRIPYSIYRIVVGFSFLQSVAALIGAGEKEIKAVEFAGSRGGPWLKVRVSACLDHMRNGHNLGMALAESGYGFPDIEIINDLATYSKFKNFNDAIKVTADAWLSFAIKDIESLMAKVNTAGILLAAVFLLLAIGGLVAIGVQFIGSLHHMQH